MAEWLRRWTRNPMGSPRAGSNPAHCGFLFISIDHFFIFISIDHLLFLSHFYCWESFPFHQYFYYKWCTFSSGAPFVVCILFSTQKSIFKEYQPLKILTWFCMYCKVLRFFNKISTQLVAKKGPLQLSVQIDGGYQFRRLVEQPHLLSSTHVIGHIFICGHQWTSFIP